MKDEIKAGFASWHYAADATQGDHAIGVWQCAVGGESKTVTDINPDLAADLKIVSTQATVGGLSLDKIKAAMAVLERNQITPSAIEVKRLTAQAMKEAEFQSLRLEVARSMAAKCRANAAQEAEYRARPAEREALAAADAERINNAAKNLPRLKASDMLKAGMLFVSEHGEQPDPEKFGPKLLVYGSMHGTMDWFTVNFDNGRWAEPADGLNVHDIECWMLPPDLKA